MHMNKGEMGTIYLCGTPIGNLEDITLRVLNTLKFVDVVYAEDTRHSVKLLNHFEISKPLHSYHEHNKVKVGPEIIQKAQNGEHIALVTDAGMPGISDPGSDLVKLCIENQVPFVIIPGVTAFTTALVGSGLDTRSFSFEGFLSREKKERTEHLERIRNDQRTLIFYESPHRLKKTLALFSTHFGNRKAVVARELTKKYETYQRGTLSELMTFYDGMEVKGEIVLLIEGCLEKESEKLPSQTPLEYVNSLMEDGMDKKEAMKKTAAVYKIKKSDVYAMLIDEDSQE